MRRRELSLLAKENRITEYEIASLFYQVVDTAQAAMTNFLTVVFAVIVVSYFAGEKLDRFASSLLIFVYSFFCFGMIREIYYLYSDLARLGWKMASFPGSTFDWHGMASSLTQGPPQIIPLSAVSMCVLGYVGSLAFFYFRRKRASSVAD